jgi:predicted phage terminase large subunit-like protein
VSVPERALLKHCLRRDLASFIQRAFQTVAPGTPYQPNWHLEVLAWHLERCLAGEITRLLLTLPPRSLKSICASVALPAWALGHDPGLRIICASYAAELAAKHARDCRAVMTSAWYREVFPRTRLDPAKASELEFTTTRGGFRLATSVGGTLTGRGGNLIVIDDPLKASDALSEAKREAANAWFHSSLYSRLDDKARDRIVVVMQRLHVDDLVGHLLRRDEGWVHVDLPAVAEADERFDLDDGRIYRRGAGEALHPERESCETLERIKRTLGGYDFAAQYQQNPVPLDGGLIKWAWFRTYVVAPERSDGDVVIQSWDTASKAEEIHDYSACTTWLRRGNEHFLLDVTRAQIDYPHLRRLVVEIAERHRADAVLVEDKGSGTQLIQDLQHDGIVRPIGITPQQDKLTRMYTQTPKIEAGYVLLPETAPWLEEFKTEVQLFPRGRHDDQVDSLSQYLGWARPMVPEGAICEVYLGTVARQWEAEFGSAESLHWGAL